MVSGDAGPRSELPAHIPGLEVLAKLSSGGMGEILLARRRGAHGFEKLLAVKVIKGALAQREDIQTMFHDEARLVARLDHPTIAQVYDFGEVDGTLYLAMEYVPGIPLNQLLARRGGPLPPLVAARIAIEVARGLHAAHELTDLEGRPLGVVHRDVSPGNLILTYDGRIKVLDFGIAFMSQRESPDTEVGELKGKPSYMAPEQLRAERVDRRSDLYALSVVLHEMLTGRKLFSKGNVVATALAVERERVAKPSTYTSLPEGLDEIVLRGLEKQPSDRFPDARALADALEAIITREGGQTLEAFVDRELGRERQGHRDWLQDILTNARNALEQATVPIDLAATPAPVPEQLTTPGRKRRTPHPGPAAESTESPAAPLAPPSPARRSRSLLALLLLSLGLAGVLFAARAWLTADVSPAPEIVATPPSPSIDAAPSLVETASAPSIPTDSAPSPNVVPTPAPEAPTPSPPRPRKPRKRRRPRPAVERPAPPPAPTKYGFLTVGSKPYALIRIDGRELGVTPLVRHRLRVGKHLLQLIRPDTGEVRLEREVLVRENAHARITHR